MHPQVNKALSAHGAFSSHAIHSDVRGPGKQEHIENIEKMAEDCHKILLNILPITIFYTEEALAKSFHETTVNTAELRTSELYCLI